MVDTRSLHDQSRDGKIRSLNRQQRRWLKRRQAVEPAIGHLKADHRMDRCWLAGSLGDALRAVLCAAGYNLRWLMRAVLRLGRKAFLALCTLAAILATFIRIGPPSAAWQPARR